MGIMSQLRDEQGGDVDMATLAQLLTGMSQGRWTDQTPFGMWGVRNMEPGKLGGLMDTAAEVNQRRMSNQENADAARRESMNRLAGTFDTNDTNYTTGMMGLQGNMLGNESRWAAENLKSRTELDKERMRGASAERAAGIMANPKSMMKIPDQVMAMIAMDLKNGKLTPDKLKWIQEMLAIMRTGDPNAGVQQMLDARTKGTPMAESSGGPSGFSFPTPGIRPGSPLSELRMPNVGNRWAAEDMLP